MSTKKKKKTKPKINNFLILLVLLSSILLIYNILLLGPIEKIIRYIIIGIIIIINISFFSYKKKKSKGLSLLMMIGFIILNLVCCFTINKVYKIVDSINKNNVIYTTNLVTKKNNEISNIEDIENKKIGLIDDNLSVDNYIIPEEIIKKYSLEEKDEIIKYDDVLVMINDLLNEKIDYAFISSNYDSMFQNIEGYEEISKEFKVVYEESKTIKKESSTKSKIEKPFSILLMGVDSEKDGLKKNAYANGDGLILLTFNPKTYNVTMMSIPRDSYVPISCRENKENKLTHAGWFGTECMMETIKNVFDVEIDYYLKVNFKGVVEIVDALGGVSVDVPKRLCTDNSNREDEICIESGIQTLNGEEALVLARNRYDLALGDIERGYNQQLLIKSLLNEVTEIRDVSTLLNILNLVSNNIDTNLTTNEILSFYNILKDLIESRKYQYNNSLINMIQIKVAGTNKKIYFENLNSNLWCYLLDDKSVEEASLEMKMNLGLEKTKLTKKLTFTPK